jgi:peptidoglycan/LPS O-acetylase OafA/YrhL
MPFTSHFDGGSLASRARFALVTVLALVTTVSLFILLKYAPPVHGVAIIAYYPPLCCLLPWLAGIVFWRKVTRRVKSGAADEDSARLCYEIIILTSTSAYVAITALDSVLLWIVFRVK